MDRTDGERIAALEVEVTNLKAESADTNALVRDIHNRMTVSKGAVMGAMAVLSGVVGFVAWLFSGALEQITNALHPPPHP